MNILALDLGTKCGWASKIGIPCSGTWNLKAKASDSIGQRYVNFKKELQGIHHAVHLDLIVYEDVHAHAAVDAAHVYGALQGVLQVFCLENKIEYRGIGVGTIKKHATGKGNAKKDDMICAAAIKWPQVNIIDDNHADALWLLDLATNQAGFTIG